MSQPVSIRKSPVLPEKEEQKVAATSPGYIISGPMSRSPSGSVIPPSEERYRIFIVTGTANQKLAGDVAACLDPPARVTACNVGRFSDGEIKMQVAESVRGHDLFVIQPCCPPDIHGSIQELALLSHTLRLASAARVTLVVPYLGYSRQDSKTQSRTPIGGLVVAKQLLSTEPNRFLFVDLHSDQIQGFFGNTPTDHLSGVWVFAHALAERFPAQDRQNMVIVAPDAAGVGRVRKLADTAGVTNVAAILSRRVSPDQPETLQLVGEVAGRVCLVFDDIIDQGERSCRSADILFEHGAKEVYAAATHGIFSGKSLERIEQSKIKRVWVTDTLYQVENRRRCSKLEVISVAPLLASAIAAIHGDKAVSQLKVWQSTELQQW
eukprot:m51a1_g8150 ribose-phosphate diphosphokinase, putative (379) ;mRNA; r:46719-48649